MATGTAGSKDAPTGRKTRELDGGDSELD